MLLDRVNARSTAVASYIWCVPRATTFFDTAAAMPPASGAGITLAVWLDLPLLFARVVGDPRTI